MARQYKATKKGSEYHIDDPVFRRRGSETSDEYGKRVAKASQGLFWYRGKWLSHAERLAAILKNPLMKNAVVKEVERPLLMGGKSFIRVTIPGTGFEMLVLRHEGDSFAEFMERVRQIMAR